MKYYFFGNFISVIVIVIVFIAAWFIRQIFTEKKHFEKQSNNS